MGIQLAEYYPLLTAEPTRKEGNLLWKREEATTDANGDVYEIGYLRGVPSLEEKGGLSNGGQDRG